MTFIKDRLKIRFWDKKNKEMNYINNWVLGGMSLNQLLKNENYIFMQCTGIKDTSGKFIYEKDYFIHKELDQDGDEELRLTCMEWDKGAVGFELHQVITKDPLFIYVGNWWGSYENSKEFKTLTIIGNEFESPQLVKIDEDEHLHLYLDDYINE